jgi:heterotetrameric sarcosine oxidase gamma subunit
LADWTPLAKVLVQAAPKGAVACALATPFGTARRDARSLIVGSGPSEWLVLAAPGTARRVAEQWGTVPDDGLATVVDVTSGRVALRLTGVPTTALLAKICALDLSAAADGSAFRSSVAKVAALIVRDDRGGPPSYLLVFDRSFGRYLAEVLLDAGQEFGMAMTGLDVEDES